MFNLFLEIGIILLLAMIGTKVPNLKNLQKISKPLSNKKIFTVDEDDNDDEEEVPFKIKNKDQTGLDKILNMDWKYKGVD